jgi:hypothetical protein
LETAANNNSENDTFASLRNYTRVKDETGPEWVWRLSRATKKLETLGSSTEKVHYKRETRQRSSAKKLRNSEVSSSRSDFLNCDFLL